MWHLTNSGGATWGEIVRAVAEYAGYDPVGIEDVPPALCGLVAPRPQNALLGSERGQLLPPLDESLRAVVREGGYRATKTRQAVYER